ncbi:MAG: hypothetical protein FWF02_04585 [Micrococcales bacterium]|nr:hypothetical protein [Micrococcales bacterium]
MVSLILTFPHLAAVLSMAGSRPVHVPTMVVAPALCGLSVYLLVRLWSVPPVPISPLDGGTETVGQKQAVTVVDRLRADLERSKIAEPFFFANLGVLIFALILTLAFSHLN